jgi:choline kinase
MRAIILAAGYGRRLAAVHDGPKSLLEIGGKTLMQRHLENLARLGVEHIGFCVGYEAEKIRGAIDASGFATRVSTVLNPDYRQGSIISLWHMRHFLTAGGDVLLMDADVLYRPDMLTRLMETTKGTVFLLDRDFEPGPEPVKLCVRGQTLVEFRKQVADDLAYDFAGESVGFFRFGESMANRLAAKTEEYLAAGRRDEPYEEAIRDLLLDDPEGFDFEDVTGIPWLEIDFPEDIERANNRILPRINGK